MAQYLVEILGDKLDLSNIKADESVRLPSPEMLKGKILVKVMSEESQSTRLFSAVAWLSPEGISAHFYSDLRHRFQSRLAPVEDVVRVFRHQKI